MNMKKMLVLPLVAAVTGLVQAGIVGDAVRPFVENGRLPGAISIVYNNGVEQIDCVGYADVAAKRPISIDDPYMQCSQTKGFCGVTIAKLVEEGKLNLVKTSKFTFIYRTLIDVFVLICTQSEFYIAFYANNKSRSRNCLTCCLIFVFKDSYVCPFQLLVDRKAQTCSLNRLAHKCIWVTLEQLWVGSK